MNLPLEMLISSYTLLCTFSRISLYVKQCAYYSKYTQKLIIKCDADS